MPLRIAVTGSPGVGKSTLLSKVAASCGLKVGGVLARDRRLNNRRVGFELLDLSSGATGTLADETGDGPQIGKYRVHTEELDQIGAKAIEDAMDSELIIVDEIGPMELVSSRFVSSVEKAMARERPMLVVLHERSMHPLAKKIRAAFKLFVVTERNRDDLFEEIKKKIADQVFQKKR